METTTKHTPGPWVVVREKLNHKADPPEIIEVRRDVSAAIQNTIASMNVYAPQPGTPICGCGGDPMSNARLIAAAPDLLAACEAALALLEMNHAAWHLKPDGPVFDALRQSIARAKAGAA